MKSISVPGRWRQDLELSPGSEAAAIDTVNGFSEPFSTEHGVKPELTPARRVTGGFCEMQIRKDMRKIVLRVQVSRGEE